MGFLQSIIGSGMSSMGGICSFLPYCEMVLLGLKIVMLLFIVGWVRSHLGGGLVATIVMLFLGYLALFQYFYIFGPLTLLYLLVIMGFAGVIQDFAFGGSHYGLGPEAEGGLMGRIASGSVGGPEKKGGPE
jgi:hypothetical protein